MKIEKVEKEDGGIVMQLTENIYCQFIDEKEKFIIDQIFQDMRENQEKYDGVEINIISRDNLKEILQLGQAEYLKRHTENTRIGEVYTRKIDEIIFKEEEE